MAQKVQVVLIDDIDGGNAEETISFGLDGVQYEIDLSHSNAARLRNAFEPFIGKARKTGRGASRRAKPGTRTGRSAEIRAWAKSQGIAVNERGRIPADLTAKFESSQQSAGEFVR